MSIPFDTIARELLARSESLLREWQPDGRRIGNEWKCGSISGGKGDSCSTNLTTGLGADFATGQTWGDLIDLYSQIRGIGMGDAARALAPHLANGHDPAPMRAMTAPPATAPPPGPPDAPGHTALYRYTDRWYVARHDKSDGSKSFRPWTWDGSQWIPKAPEKPRPLFSLDELAARPTGLVLVVEGEKACLAARGLLPGYVVVTWAGGASSVAAADWEPLRGRTVHIWPDADQPGREAAAKVSGLILHIAESVTIVDTGDAPSEGWDLADAVADGWTTAQTVAWGRPRLQPVEKPPADEAPPKTPQKRPKTPAGSDPTSAGVPAYVLWEQLQLARNDRGPYATEANALRIIASHDAYAGRIWLDEFSQRLMIDDDPAARLFSRTDAIAALVWMQEALQLPKMPLSAVERAAVLVGERNKRHPVKDWLESLPGWDGIERLPDLLANAWGTRASAYASAVGRCWIVAMIARIYQPGCKHDYLPVFEGPQGRKKSSALSILAGQWFLESNENPVANRKDFLLSMQGKWLVEIPEIDRVGGTRGSLMDLTGMITIRTDTYRVPYGATTMDYPRQTVFSGTTNQDQWQPDHTGGRRFWPVTCGEIDLEYLAEIRTQLFAEAAHRYRAGEQWWDVPETDARDQQEGRRITDEWEALIAQFFTHTPDRKTPGRVWWIERNQPLQHTTVMDLLEHAIGMPERTWDMGSQKRVAKACAAIGLTRQRPTIDGKRTWVWAKPNTFAANGSE